MHLQQATKVQKFLKVQKAVAVVAVGAAVQAQTLVLVQSPLIPGLGSVLQALDLVVKTLDLVPKILELVVLVPALKVQALTFPSALSALFLEQTPLTVWFSLSRKSLDLKAQELLAWALLASARELVFYCKR